MGICEHEGDICEHDIENLTANIAVHEIIKFLKKLVEKEIEK